MTINFYKKKSGKNQSGPVNPQTLENIRPKESICVQTVQDTVPIYAVHENANLIESYPGCFSKSYEIKEINFQTSTVEEQELTMTKYRSLINSWGSNMEAAITIFNRNVNLKQFAEETLLKETGDKFDSLRKQLNKILIGRISDGKNALKKEKILTLALHTSDVKKADEVFSKRLDDKLNADLKGILSASRPLKIDERLEIIHDIYNMGTESEFLVKTKVLSDNGKTEEITSFDMENIRSQGLSINDVIAPSSMVFNKDYIELAGQYARVMHIPIDGLPTELSNEFVTNITNMSFNMVTTITIKPISNDKTRRIVSQNLQLVRQEKHSQQQNARRNNYSEDMIDPHIIEREQECLEMRENITQNNEKLFETTFTFIIFASTLEELDEYSESLIAEGKKENVTIQPFFHMQEKGFNVTLPLCYNALDTRRTLTSSSLAVMIPFSNLEINERGGINYTMNANSKNLILYDRTTKPNYNGFVLGSSGSGKSFVCKTEIVNVFLKTTADIMIIDPEREYVTLADELDGQVIELKPGGTKYINPLDIDITYEMDGSESNPILEKASFIMKLFESMLNEVWGMDSIQKTLIDECIIELYKPFLDENGQLTKSIPREQTPTLNDMMAVFSRMRDPEARKLYMTLKRYAGNGTLNIFSHHTNIDIHNRIVVFDISAVGDELKLMAMNIIQDALWSRLCSNRRIGRYTFIYIDECHLFFQSGNDSAANFLCEIWKRARKYNGVPTGITQNVEDMIDHPIAKKLLAECNFIQVLAQSASARDSLKEVLHLSDASMDYITNIVPGQGLFYTGSSTVPFYSQFPKDNDIYPLLTSNATEILEFKERKRREELKRKKQEKASNYK